MFIDNIFNSYGHSAFKCGDSDMADYSDLSNSINQTASIIEGVSSQIAQEKENEASREWASAENDESRQFSVEMWEANNEYNTPSAQYERLIDAGMNPWAAYNKISSGATSSAAATPSITSPSGVSSDYSSSARIISDALMQGDLIKSQIQKNETDSGKTKAETQTIDAIRDASVKKEEFMASLTEEQINETKAKVDNLHANTAYIDAMAVLSEQQYKFNEEMNPLLINMQKEEINKVKQEIKNLVITGELNKAQIDVCKKQLKVMDSVISLNESKAAFIDGPQTYLTNRQGDLAGANKLKTQSETTGQNIANRTNDLSGGAKVAGAAVGSFLSSFIPFVKSVFK